MYLTSPDSPVFIKANQLVGLPLIVGTFTSNFAFVKAFAA